MQCSEAGNGLVSPERVLRLAEHVTLARVLSEDIGSVVAAERPSPWERRGGPEIRWGQ